MIKIALDAAVGPVVGMVGAVTLDGAAMIPLGAALGAVVTLVGLSIKMTKQWTVMEQTISRMQDAHVDTAEAMKEIKDSQQELARKFEHFPCPQHQQWKRGTE
jgi:hypothetical protein